MQLFRLQRKIYTHIYIYIYRYNTTLSNLTFSIVPKYKIMKLLYCKLSLSFEIMFAILVFCILRFLRECAIFSGISSQRIQ